MGKYVYQKKKLHISRYRRKGDGTPSRQGTKDGSTDRRRKVRQGIIIQDYERRGNADSEYDGEEQRSGKERRSGKDRRG